MSVSQLDPTLLTLTPSERSGPPPPGSQTSGPDVTGLTLASNLSIFSGTHSPQLSTTTKGASCKKKQHRRTQKEMAVFRLEQVQKKKLKALEKAKEKRSKGQFRPSCCSTQTSASEQTQGNSTQQSALTTVGKTKVTKGAAYDMFAIFMNSSSNHRLRLTGSQLCQRIDGYRKQFMKAKDFAENTGAGIEEGDGLPTLAELLKKKCPCYERMYAIFGGKANLTPLAQFDSGVGADLYADSSNARDVDDPSLNLPNSEGEGDLENDLLPPPLDFSGTAMDPSPSLMTQRSITCATQGSAIPSANGGVLLPMSSHPAGPTREGNGKPKATLASAFESSNSEKFAYLQEHMAWEKEKEDNRLAWEKERYKKETKQATEGAQGQAKLAEAKLNAAQEWISQGKLSTEVNLLLKAIYG
ncbi:hypothetical protein PGTUg99_008247 [Puccinia graminis f. sp. tritici]|uniref:Uncharacterized protein n=1 Tax=Puccinia graminis f. sp. tritici TaxID=56615 RepID=A0A5B0R7E0_PUCGR|nr:hypothetical protein PGTUg99_008247 [Puccinia graminis f. sp. tritici]